jgi:hypothetical protein
MSKIGALLGGVMKWASAHRALGMSIDLYAVSVGC